MPGVVPELGLRDVLVVPGVVVVYVVLVAVVVGVVVFLVLGVESKLVVMVTIVCFWSRFRSR